MSITCSRWGVGVSAPSPQAKHEAIMLDSGEIVYVSSSRGTTKKTAVFAAAAALKTHYSGTYANGVFTPGT